MYEQEVYRRAARAATPATPAISALQLKREAAPVAIGADDDVGVTATDNVLFAGATGAALVMMVGIGAIGAAVEIGA